MSRLSETVVDYVPDSRNNFCNYTYIYVYMEVNKKIKSDSMKKKKSKFNEFTMKSTLNVLVL